MISSGLDRPSALKTWSLNLTPTFLFAMVAGFLLLTGAGTSAAGTIPCEPATCGWSISVNGAEVMSGVYEIDADGNVSLPNPVGMSNSDFSVSIDSIGGHVDPELIFGLGATNTSGVAQTFAFAFNLPLGGFSGLIDTYAELGQTLSAASGGAGLNLFPILGGGLIVDSQDIRFSPSSSVDKGVDVGDSLFAAAGTTVLDLDTATSQILLTGGGYDLMSVVVAFGLDSNGGVGLSGRVVQTVVPEPTTALLMLLGLGALSARRRSRDA